MTQLVMIGDEMAWMTVKCPICKAERENIFDISPCHLCGARLKQEISYDI